MPKYSGRTRLQVPVCPFSIRKCNNSSDGRVVRASASGAVDLGLIPSRIQLMTIKLVFTAFLLDAQHYRNNVANKSASLLVVSLGKALNGINGLRPQLGPRFVIKIWVSLSLQ